MNCISDTSATRDPVPTRTVAKKDVSKGQSAIEHPVAEDIDQSKTVTHLTRMEATPMMNATISPIERTVKAIAANESTANGYPDEI